MISISPIRGYNRINYKASFKSSDVSDIMARADKALNENKYDEALKLYLEAGQANPEDVNINRKMAKAQKGLQDYASAIENFNKYLEQNPNDSECWGELGEVQSLKGAYMGALNSFEKAKELDPESDYAQRNILETKNKIIAMTNPQRAKAEKDAYASNNLKTALEMTVAYMTPEYMKQLNDVTICFGPTAEMGGTANIAQYENNTKRTTVSSSLIYASPQVIAAYLSHEAVHAHDKDGYTSITEEQDAYETAAKFWKNNSGGVKDPEMDYALSLYNESPMKLRDRVEEIYKLRDPSISKTSPNHPPSKKFQLFKTTTQNASQPLKEYNVIA